jgi:nucleoside-diphosphate-sugar epimerase
VIPTIISQVAAGCQEVMLGDTETTRDFTFVQDTCRGLVALAETDGGIGEVLNIGSNFEISIRELFHTIAELMDSKSRIHADETRKRPERSEVMRLWCDNSKLKAATGFRPQATLRDGLSQTIEWFRRPENLKQYKTELYNV